MLSYGGRDALLTNAQLMENYSPFPLVQAYIWSFISVLSHIPLMITGY